MEIEYTQAMATQDYLWNKQQEDLEAMNKLQWQIIADFLRSGNKERLHFKVYLEGNESIVDVYNESSIGQGGQVEGAISCGNCKALIKTIQKLMLESNAEQTTPKAIGDMDTPSIGYNKRVYNLVELDTDFTNGSSEAYVENYSTLEKAQQELKKQYQQVKYGLQTDDQKLEEDRLGYEDNGQLDSGILKTASNAYDWKIQADVMR